MARRALSLAQAIELSSRITRDDDSLAGPLIELLIGLTNSNGDAAYAAIRMAVLKNLYSQTDDFNRHFLDYIDESSTPKPHVVVQLHSSASSSSALPAERG